MKKDLSPLSFDSSDAEKVEEAIIKLLREELYLPLISDIGIQKKTLLNSTDDLLTAVRSGRIWFYRGRFKGKYNSKIALALKNIGARWDAKHGSFSIPLSKMPIEVKIAIAYSEDRFKRVARTIDERLASFIPEKIASLLNIEKIFDRSIFKVEKKVDEQLGSLVVSQKMTDKQRESIAKEYTNNMRLYIQEWTEKEIVNLRSKMQKKVSDGVRYEDMIKTIQKSYGVSQSKAKFLARQETNLLTTTMQKERYLDAGVIEYRWQCVVGSDNHPVRHTHKMLDGKVFRWDDPPITDEKGSRNHPGQDFGCRCKARPIVKFNK